MTKTRIIWAAAAVLILVILTVAPPAAANKQIAAAEGMSCTACHDKPGSIRLTNRGKFYELMGSFDAYDELSEKFGTCTTCHKRRPGSTKLTAEGKKFRELHGGMKALCADVLKEKDHSTKAEQADGVGAESTSGSKAATPPAFVSSH